MTVRGFVVALLMGSLVAGPLMQIHANAAESRPADGSWRCAAPPELLDLGAPLPRTRSRLARDEPLRILALGSSSTQGHGASRPEAAYPARLESQLGRRHPSSTIVVVNAGVGGDTAVRMRARLEREVESTRPDLVIWQTGANDAIREVDLAAFTEAIADGVRWLRSRGIDVLLVPPQFSPVVNRSPTKERYIDAMRDLARSMAIPFFRRYEIVRVAQSADGTTVDALFTRDGLHHNDLGYRCLAAQIADAIEGVGEPKRRATLDEPRDEVRRGPRDGDTVPPLGAGSREFTPPGR